ncbi:DJ-1/PfpI family protein [Streptococcus iniae]|uniref:DJ-1/PfpI family protein n=1 Tax=Streptococcus iniae TaxID=1346 RepID=UPI002B2F385C|nr:DJ-1/PfpI family protein [Streptococcus iniae]
MKIGLIIYPEFSLYEITPLTAQLALNYHQQVDIIAEEKKCYVSEDGFQVMPEFAFSQVKWTDYDALFFTGTMKPFETVLNATMIENLALINSETTVIVAMSSSPLILAKAGLIKDRTFTGGIYTNLLSYFSWLNEDKFMDKHCVVDGKLITALGTKRGVEEFTNSVLYILGFLPSLPELSQEKISFTLCNQEFDSLLLAIKKDYPLQFKEIL